MMSSDLCEELIVDIFSRLPTKSLLRFRSVSKSLYACIGSPEFVRLHTLTSPEKIMLIHFNNKIQEGEKYWRNTYTLHFEDQFPYNINIGITKPVAYHFRRFSIAGSCNGILCLFQNGIGFTLYNPSIRRKLIVHYPRSWGRRRSIYEFGFGFDPVIDDYKILRISTPTSFIYSLKSHTWREIASLITPFFLMNSYQCLFSGGLHCVVLGNPPRDVRKYSYILKFNLSSEVFSKIELPEPTWETSAVTVIKGSLAVFSSEPKQDNSLIWVMRDYSNPASWSVAFKLNTHRFLHTLRVFQLTASDDLLLDIFLEGIHVYNPESHERSKLMGLGDSSQIVDFIKCTESLGLLDIGISC